MLQFAVIVILVSATASFGQNNDDAVLSWVKQHSHPIASVSPTHGSTADLAPLKNILQRAQVVGAGEATHGAHEFQTFKHRLFRFLVTEMAFNAIAIEGSYSSFQGINDYVVNGKGNRADALSGTSYTPWDTKEMSELVDWIREHNRSIADPKKRVRFIGLDVNYNDVGREKVMAWLKKNAPDKVADAGATFQVLADEEGKWPFRTDQQRILSMLPAIQRVVAAVKHLEGKASDPLDDIYLYARIMEQWVNFASPGSNLRRSASMGENLVYILKAMPELKVMLWAANGHISRIFPDGTASAGKVIGDALGSRYYSIGLLFHKGTMRCRTVAPDKRMGDFGEEVASALDDSTVPGLLHKAKSGNMYLDLNGIPKESVAVSSWFAADRRGHAGSWACNYSQPSSLTSSSMGRRFHGVMFVETITPTIGTPNSLKSAAERRFF